MLELVPRQWKVIQHVRGEVLLPQLREDHSPPAPSASESRAGPGRGPGLLAHVLFGKYGLHLPLTRQRRLCP